MQKKNHQYATNSIIMNRLGRENAVHTETANNKDNSTVDKYVRNIYIQRNDESGTPVEFGFWDNDCKPKSRISYNKKGLPIKEVFRSNYGIGDYTAVSYFTYDEHDKLISVRTKIDDGAEYVRNYS